MAGWKEVVFKSVTAADLGLVGAAQGNLLMGNASSVYANLTAGAANKVLTAHGVAAALTWETPFSASGSEEGSLMVSASTPFGYSEHLHGTTGDVLTTKGHGAQPTWETPAPASGVAQGNLLVAGAGAGYTYANFTAGTAGKVLTSGGVDNALTWTTPTVGDFLANGTVAMTGNLDMNDNCLVDAKLYTTVPGVPADGHIYFDTTTDKVKVYVA